MTTDTPKPQADDVECSKCETKWNPGVPNFMDAGYVEAVWSAHALVCPSCGSPRKEKAKPQADDDEFDLVVEAHKWSSQFGVENHPSKFDFAKFGYDLANKQDRQAREGLEARLETSYAFNKKLREKITALEDKLKGVRDKRLKFECLYTDCVADLTSERELVKELVEALGYYANSKNWYSANAVLGKDLPGKPIIKMVIASLDTEGDEWLGGRTARIALAKYWATVDGK